MCSGHVTLRCAHFFSCELITHALSQVLMQLLMETKASVDISLSSQIYLTVMRKMLALTDDDLKKEPADVMGGIVKALECLEKSEQKVFTTQFIIPQ